MSPHTDPGALLKLADANHKDAEEFCRGAFGPLVSDVSQYVTIVAELMQHATDRALQAASQGRAGGERSEVRNEGLIAELRALVGFAKDTRVSAEAIGLRISNNWPQYEEMIAALSDGVAQAVQVPCPVCGGEAIHALDVLKRTVIREPIRWDANENRSYEPVETLATEIYDGLVYDGPAGTTKPKWTPGGNGLKQDFARFEARRSLREAGHSPSVPSAHRGGE